MFSRDELAAGFRALGVRAGDLVMLHASVRAVGPVAGGPDQIHLALKDALTLDGTLLMYASCPEHYDEVGRGHLSAEEEHEILAKLPPFEAATARSARDNGARVWRTMEEFDTSDAGAHANWPARFFARIVDAHLARTGNGGGRVGGAESFLIESRPLLEFALDVMRAVAADPSAAGRLLD